MGDVEVGAGQPNNQQIRQSSCSWADGEQILVNEVGLHGEDWSSGLVVWISLMQLAAVYFISQSVHTN